MNNRTEIDFGVGSDISDAVKQLEYHKNAGRVVYGVFNGVTLCSDIDNMDSAYRKITGKTKAEFDEAAKKDHAEYLEREEKHKAAVPELTKEWIKKGEDVLDKKYHEQWAKCVPIRLGDLYKGMELGACLAIVERLNAGCELSEAKTIIEGQGHSGMSFSLVCSMVKSFCERGSEFVAYVRS